MGPFLPKRTDTSDTTQDEQGGLSAAEAAELRRQLAAAQSTISARDTELGTERKRRRDAEFAGMSAQEQAIVSQQEACDGEISSLQSEADALENQIATLADEPGNGKQIAELTRKLSRAETNLSRAEERKQWLSGQREQVTTRNKETREAATREDQQPTGRKMANGFPYDNFPPKTKAWVDAHPQAFTDKTYWDRVIRFAQEAGQDYGFADESPEYFSHIERRLGEVSGTRRASQQDDPEDDQQDDEPEEGEDLPEEVPQRRVAESYTPERPQERAAGPGSMAARPSRQVPQGGGNNGNRRVSARLTAQEREAADSLYGNIANPADRYQAYADGKKYMAERQPGHFRN